MRLFTSHARKWHCARCCSVASSTRQVNLWPRCYGERFLPLKLGTDGTVAGFSNRWRTGGPFKPDFGLSGALRRLDRVFPLLARAGVRSIRTRFQLVPRRRCVMEKAAPRPVFGALAQSLCHRVPMNVVQFLYKLRMIANVEIVVSLLPEMIGIADQTPCPVW
jgi:hypothetical protein